MTREAPAPPDSSPHSSHFVPQLIAYLQGRQNRGETHVRLDEEARRTLRTIYRGQHPLQSQSGQEPVGQHASHSEAKDLLSSVSAPAQLPPSQTAAHPSIPEIVGHSREDILANLRAQAEHWAPAQALGTLRSQMVFATGNPHARLVLVGEGPGYHEEQQQEPFVGPAGQKLNQILGAMGLSRPDDVYITNICKFRPAMPGQTTNNRKPNADEIHACLPFVQAEIQTIQPEVIIALGATAAEALLNTDKPVGRLRGEWHQYHNVPLRVTYHPSYLLRNDSQSLREKRKVWEDMLEVMERLKLPISEKQRGYFRST